MFPDAPSIAPYLEHPKTGPTSSFCAALASRLKCYVVAGCPERLVDAEPAIALTPPARSPAVTSTPTPNPNPTLTNPPPPLGANAALLYDTTGHLLHTYHKSNLFPTDLTWARPGPGFTTLDLPMPFGRTAVAICNDVNVDTGAVWDSIERGPYELAGYCRREGVRVLVLLNAWLKEEEEGDRSGSEDVEDEETDSGEVEMEDDRDGDGDDEDGLEPNWSVLNYWAMRLRPLWAKDTDAGEDAQDDERDCLVVICNRFGHERGALSISRSRTVS